MYAPAHAPTVITITARVAINGSANGNADSEGDYGGCDDVARAVTGDNHRSAIHNGRVVSRDIDNLWICRLDDDYLRAFLDHLDLTAGLEVAGRVGLRAHALNSGQDSVLLSSRGVAESRGPRNISGESIEDRRELGDGLNGRIPIFLLHGVLQGLAGETRVGLDEGVGVDNLIGKSCGSQDLGDEGIGIKRDGRDQGVEIAVGKIGVRFLWCGGRSGRSLLGNCAE